jgi:hypothetical protein
VRHPNPEQRKQQNDASEFQDQTQWKLSRVRMMLNVVSGPVVFFSVIHVLASLFGFDSPLVVPPKLFRLSLAQLH